MSSATAAASTPTVPLSAAPALVAPAGRLQPAPRWALWSAFAVIYLVWGSTFLGIRVAVETLPPLTMSGFRFLVAGGILLLVTARVRPRPSAREWLNAGFIGSLFFLRNHGLISNAARYLPSSLVCLIISAAVPIIAQLSSFFLGLPLTRGGLLGAVLGFGGVLVLCSGPAFACYSDMLKHVRADAVATHVFVNPLVAVAVGAWLGGEKLQPVHFLSGLLILASVSVILLEQRQRKPDRGGAPARVAAMAE